MSRILQILAATLLAGTAVSGAQAATYVYNGTLSGSQEVPTTPSSGTGSVSVVYDDVLRTLRVAASFSGLTGNSSAAHIHVSTAPGGNGPVATQVPTFAGFPLGVTSGAYDATFDLTSAASFNPTFVSNNGGTVGGAEAALLAGLNSGRAYFNLHSVAFPSGEIRANLAAVPEPATWAMMLAGFGLLGGAMRTRRMTVRFS